MPSQPPEVDRIDHPGDFVLYSTNPNSSRGEFPRSRGDTLQMPRSHLGNNMRGVRENGKLKTCATSQPVGIQDLGSLKKFCLRGLLQTAGYMFRRNIRDFRARNSTRFAERVITRSLYTFCAIL